MITVTRKQFEEFILSQPDDRELDFNANYIPSDKGEQDCNCPMVDYGLQNNLPAFDTCFSNCWGSLSGQPRDMVAEFENGVYFEDYGTDHRTYGELKRAVLKYREIASRLTLKPEGEEL